MSPEANDPTAAERGLPSATAAADRPVDGAGYCLIAGQALLAADGDDATGFLQGQLTGDLRRLEGERLAMTTAYCSQKGRVLAGFTVFRTATGYLLQLGEDQAEAIARRLQMFILRSKVRLARAEAQWCAIGLWGEGLAAELAADGAELPGKPWTGRATDDRLLARMPGEPARFELLVRREALDATLDWLAARAEAHPPAAWRLAGIRAAQPAVDTATQEAFLPQMLNLDLLDGVAFDKGCFVGQEVVARLKYLGKVKRRMLIGTTEVPAAPGDRLDSESSRSGQGAGVVVDACINERGATELLAVVELAAADGPITLGESHAPVTLNPPPYPVPELQGAPDGAPTP